LNVSRSPLALATNQRGPALPGRGRAESIDASKESQAFPRQARRLNRKPRSSEPDDLRDFIDKMWASDASATNRTATASDVLAHWTQRSQPRVCFEQMLAEIPEVVRGTVEMTSV